MGICMHFFIIVLTLSPSKSCKSHTVDGLTHPTRRKYLASSGGLKPKLICLLECITVQFVFPNFFKNECHEISVLGALVPCKILCHLAALIALFV